MHFSGDLHDGNGLSDAALPNGVDSNPIFDEIDYDVLTIGMLDLNLSILKLISAKATTNCM